MAAHRYWRATHVEPYDAGPQFVLGEFALLASGVRVDGAAALTSSVAPITGLLSNLADNDLSTDVTFSVGATLQWDFAGAPQDVTNIGLGGATDVRKFPLIVGLDWSDDGLLWTRYATFSGIAWPGARTMTSDTNRVLDETPWANTAKAEFSIATGFADEVRAPWVPYNSASVVAGDEPYGSGALVFSGAAYVLSSAPSPALTQWAAGPYTAECWVKYSAWSAQRNLFGSYSQSTGTNDWAFGADSTGRLVLFYWNGSASNFVSSTSPVLSLNTWHHVALVHEAGTIRLTLDGATVATGTVVGTPAYSALSFILGYQEGLRPLSAKVKGLRVSSVARYPGARPLPAPFIALNRVPGRTSTPAPAVVASSGATPAFSGALLQSVQRARADFRFDPTARGRIIGTVKEKNAPTNTPLARRVRLYRDRDGMLIAETWSNAAGNFVFEGIEEGEAYTTLSHDHTHNYRAVAADNLTLANGGVEVVA